MSNEILKITKEKQSLIQKIIDFLNETKNNEIELKPKYNENTSISSNAQFEKNLELLEKNYAADIDKQLYIIAENIIFYLKSLSNEQYKAILDRFLLWGISQTIEEFIINYYLIIKKDINLQQFIVMHMNKLIKIVENILDTQSILKITKQNFLNDNDNELEKLYNKLKEKEQKLIKIIPEKNIKKSNIDPIKSEETKQDIRQQILNDLKNQNPELENI